MGELADEVIDAAETVIDDLGPGFSESVYETALVHELGLRQIGVTSQATFPVMYRDNVPVGRVHPDLVVEADGGDPIVIELKASGYDPTSQAEQYLELAQTTESIGYTKALGLSFGPGGIDAYRYNC